jgi:hypothetical protein
MSLGACLPRLPILPGKWDDQTFPVRSILTIHAIGLCASQRGWGELRARNPHGNVWRADKGKL